ncbi:putative aldehyde dehydrogenase [Naematelia encephala]|uniref:Putative aldehyde dehydrogenase n=1 Tax=Naematelia encephala TaxID=71784 RepID=A0A1Y2BJS5_9TREE|nr:putative aldehyde dehydrogenase [Naematelia encephala]
MVNVNIQTTISPYTQKPLLTRPLLSDTELDGVISESLKAQKSWKKVTLDERIAVAEKWLVEFEKLTDLMAEDISLSMGRPISSCKGEVGGTLYRARHLIKIARDCLRAVPQDDASTDALKMIIVKQPIGVIGVITPWNYPLLCTVNTVIPAIISGNSVIIKPAPQTPVPAERFLSSFQAAGLPANILQVVHLTQATTLEKFCQDPRIDFVAFTGSVAGGRAVQQAASNGKGFKGVGLELGGKDPAYVRADADLKYAVENLVDGAMFNSGQSCCAVERIYVHSSLYDEFVKQFVEIAKQFKLGDPSDPTTTLGPVVSLASAERIRKQVKDAVAAGAKLVLDESAFPQAKEGTTLVGPQVLVDVDHTMEVMMEETFGPVIGIMKVESDEEALGLMNDSPYGLTASIWTSPTDPASLAVFNSMVDDLECGMVYMNRADALEPSLPWSGWKDSGRGVSLSTLGYDHLTRAKAVCMRVQLA